MLRIAALGRYLFGHLTKLLRTAQEKKAYWLGMPLLLFIFLLSISSSGTQAIKPELKAHIESIFVNNIESDNPNLIIVASIENSGLMPSIARTWLVTIKHEGHVINCPIETMPEKIDMNVAPRGNIKGRTVTYYGKDNLAVKTISPIPSGGFVQGILLCALRNINAKSLKAEDEYTIYFTDVLSKKHSAVLQVTSEYSDIKYIPGMSQDIK